MLKAEQMKSRSLPEKARNFLAAAGISVTALFAPLPEPGQAHAQEAGQLIAGERYEGELQFLQRQKRAMLEVGFNLMRKQTNEAGVKLVDAFECLLQNIDDNDIGKLRGVNDLVVIDLAINHDRADKHPSIIQRLEKINGGPIVCSPLTS